MRRYPRSAMTALALLCAAGLLWTERLAAQTMGWDELRALVERSVHLRASDAQTAARLRKVQPAEAVPADAAERAASWDAGPLTQQELRRLAERSAGKPAPGQAASLRKSPRGMQPIRGGEHAVVLELVRMYAQEYAASIPNFLCYRNTRFLEERTPLGRWKLDTELKERLSHAGDEDKHEIVAIDGEEVDGDTLFFSAGLTVSGEFGNVMRRVFEPETETTFTWMAGDPGAEEAVVLGFEVSEEKSSMRISAGDEEATVGYVGEVYASPSTGQIFRVRLTMNELPKGHPIRGATWDIHYGPVKVEEQELLLPVRAAVEAHQQGRFVRNEATYTDYQKYTAASSIQFGETVSAPE